MAVALNDPLNWQGATGADAAMLDDLQANIVKAHVRDCLTVLFLEFHTADAGRAFLRAVAPEVKSAKTHLGETVAFTANGTPGTVYVGIGLTAAGYRAIDAAAPPGDTSFDRGMKDPATRTTLADPPTSLWELPYRDAIHAVVLIGDANETSVSAEREKIVALLSDDVTVVAEETGVSQRNLNGDGLEHFGYVDGRSQPLFLTEELQAENDAGDGTDVWDPSAPLGQVIVADPGVPGSETAFGSYFIFRKLEQNVQRFKAAEQLLADALGLQGDDRERAGAMMVGRFEDGTPVVLQRSDGLHSPVPNNFTYDNDPFGARCPFASHIRTTNPRGSAAGDAQGRADEKSHLMARRGQTYGTRCDDINDPEVPPGKRPTGGVGLLFMAFNSKIHFSFEQGAVDVVGSQFDFTQAAWANNPQFPPVAARSGPAGFVAGVDPVMGQGSPRSDQAFATQWGLDPLRAGLTAAAQAVHMRGGDYFFMPSLSYLENPA